MELTSVVSGNVNVFFFFEVKMFKGQVRVIARAGASARMKLLTLGTSLEFHVFFFFFIHRYKKKNRAFSNLFHYIFPMNIQKDCLVFFFYAPLGILE